MFKFDDIQEQQVKKEVCQAKRSIEKRRKVPGMGIKLASHCQEENKPNINNRRKIDVISSGSKNHQNCQKIASNKGIHVLSSRQASSERRQLSSRSRQKQKESRQIRSQSNVSQFVAQSVATQKQSLVEAIQPSKSQYEEYCLMFQHKMKEMIVKSQVAHRVQVDQLKDVINQNQQRINNLIITLNKMIDKNEKRQKLIQRLESRLQSLTSYHEQCYSYNLQRCNDIQATFRILSDQIEGITNRDSIDLKMQNIDKIVNSIFMNQRCINKQNRQFSQKKIQKLYKMVQNMQKSVDAVELMNISRQKLEIKQKELQSYLISIRNCCVRQKEKQRQKMLEMENVLKILQGKVEIYQRQKVNDRQRGKENEVKAEQTIWQLSNLLNKYQRQIQGLKNHQQKLKLQLLQKQNELNTSEICRKQLQLKLTHYSLNQKDRDKLQQLQTSIKHFQLQNHNKIDQLLQQKDSYKNKFQELFRHNQYLEEINCSNKIQIMEYQKEIQKIKEICRKKEKDVEELARLKAEMGVKEEYWENKVKLEVLEVDMSLRVLRQQNGKLQGKLTQNEKQIVKLQQQVEKLSRQKGQLQLLKARYLQQYKSLKQQFQQQQQYSQHLQAQNEKLTENLNNYKNIFQNQSTIFKNTIDKLKQQNNQLHKNLDIQSDKIFAHQPKKYKPQCHRSPSIFSRDSKESTIQRKSQQE